MMMVAAGCVALVSLGVMILFFKKCYSMGMGEVVNPFSDRRNIASFAILSVLAFFLCWQLVEQDHFVFYWDFGHYWTLSYTTMKDFFAHPYGVLKHVLQSIAHDDYNLFLPFLLVLPLKVFGYTFQHYIMIVFTCFLLPSIYILSSLAWKLLPPEARRPQMYLAILFLAFTFNAMYGATIYGYADAGCMIPASLALLAAVDCDILAWNPQQRRRDLCIALLLVCTFLMRRYFAYFIVGYMAALVACALPALLSRGWQALRPLVKNLCVIGGTALVTLLIFCTPMLKHILLTNYSQQYEGYNLPFLEKVLNMAVYMGPFVIAASILAVLAAIFAGRWRRMTSFACISFLVTTLDFFKVQSMGVQHAYTICVPIILLIFLAYAQVMLRLRITAQRVFSGLLGIFLLVGILHVFQIGPRELPAPAAKVYPAYTFFPLQRSDLSELRALADCLNEQADAENLDIYVLASGETLNSEVLDAMDKPYGEKAVPRLHNTHDVDLRDGFPTDFLRAGLVVVTDPVEVHLAPGTQEIVRYLAVEVQDPKSPVGRHFEREEQVFSLDRGVEAFIYRKTSDFTQEDLQALADYYTEKYPGQEKLFSDRIFSGKE